jgi:hypothetical protein
MNSHLQMAFWSAAAIVGISFTNGEAGVVAVKKAATVQAGQPGTTTHSQVLKELHEAIHLLDHANHDYNGHRAKADHEVHKAIHILHPHHHKTTTTAKTAAVPKPAAAKTGQHKHVHEPQQASDTQLRQAEKLVHAALLELHKHHGEKAHEASKHLHHAIHEIQQAIHLHHKHHNKNQAAVAKN